MNEVDSQSATPAMPSEPAQVDISHIAVARIVYILYAVGLFVPLTFIAGVIVDYVKIDDVRNTWLETHFRWQIRTFWWGLLWTALGFVLSLVIVGYFVLLAAAVWVLYRIIKGWLRLEDGKEMVLQTKAS